MSKRVLQSTETSKTKALTVKLPAALYDEIQAFRADLHRVAPNLIFNASALCAEALEDALKRARKELEALQAEKVGATIGEASGAPQTAAQSVQGANPQPTPAPTTAEAPEQRGGLFSGTR